ncbi:MAG: arylsulfatase [Planctomycetaceae bacterium]|nr:arylsulfatase [Planctomycetaceae bacterium]
MWLLLLMTARPRQRRLVWAVILAGPITAASHARAADEHGKAAPPNIILIVADDLGYGEVGCYGQQIIRTPRIDQLAAQGMRFTDFYAGAPVCAPSRCVLMTGKHLGHAYVRDNGGPRESAAELEKLKEKYHWEFPGQLPIPDGEVTMAELLQDCGYATAAIGKWGLGHFGTTGDPNRQGFDLFYGYNCQWHAHNHYPKFLWRNAEKVPLPGNDRGATGRTFSQDKFTETALQFIRDHKDEPFFLYLPLVIPHLSIQVPEESLQEYAGQIPETPYEHRGYLKHPTPHAAYAAMITHMDRDIGKIVDLVDQLGLGPDTLIMFTSDNGPAYDRLGGSDSEFFNSAAGLRGLKGSVYEGGIREPLVARWTGHIAADSVSRLPAAFYDLLPTFSEVAGAQVPADVDGVSLLPTLVDRGAQQQHEFLVWEFPGYGGQQAIRMGRWKGVRRNMARGNDRLELYDLLANRAETDDVAADHPDIVARMEQLLRDEWSASAHFSLAAKSKD